MIRKLADALEKSCRGLVAQSNLVFATVGDSDIEYHDARSNALISPKENAAVLVHVYNHCGSLYLPGWEHIMPLSAVKAMKVSALKDFVKARGVSVDFEKEAMLHLEELGALPKITFRP